MIENVDYFVRVIPLPCGVNGLVSPNADGTFNVYLNMYADREHQIAACEHEIAHIKNDDFYSGMDIRAVEGL